MAPDSLEAVKRIYAAINADRALPVALFAPHCVTDLSQVSPGAEEAHGRDASQEALGAYFDTFEDFHVELEEVLSAGERCVVTAIRDGGHIRGSSAEVWSHYFHVWTLSDGMVIRLSSHTEMAEALEAAARAQ